MTGSLLPPRLVDEPSRTIVDCDLTRAASARTHEWQVVEGFVYESVSSDGGPWTRDLVIVTARKQSGLEICSRCAKTRQREVA